MVGDVWAQFRELGMGGSRHRKPPGTPYRAGSGTGLPGTPPEAVPLPAQLQGCRGRSPRQNKLKVSPFPSGEGGWGDGERRFM